MLTQAAGFAILAAISPTALLVAAVFLGSANPRRTAFAYLAGALVMTASMAVIVFVVLRAGHLNLPQRHQVRYEVRLALGVLALLAVAYLAQRRRRRALRAQRAAKSGLITRMVEHPGARTAFLVGLLLYSPSITFVAAVQVVATSNSNLARTAVVLTAVVVIAVLFVWLPLLLYLLAPERTNRLLAQFNDWLRRHGQLLLMAALAACGLLLSADGVLGLTGVR